MDRHAVPPSDFLRLSENLDLHEVVADVVDVAVATAGFGEMAAAVVLGGLLPIQATNPMVAATAIAKCTMFRMTVLPTRCDLGETASNFRQGTPFQPSRLRPSLAGAIRPGRGKGKAISPALREGNGLSRRRSGPAGQTAGTRLLISGMNGAATRPPCPLRRQEASDDRMGQLRRRLQTRPRELKACRLQSQRGFGRIVRSLPTLGSHRRRQCTGSLCSGSGPSRNSAHTADLAGSLQHLSAITMTARLAATASN